MVFNQEQVDYIRLVYIFYEVLSIFNLLFILNNIFRYVIGLKMTKTLIVIFYVLIFVGTLLRIIEYGFWISDTSGNLVKKSNQVYYADNFSLIAQVFVELTLMMTMHRLYLAIKIILGQISLNSMKRAEKIGLVFIIVLSLMFLFFEVFSWTQKHSDKELPKWLSTYYSVYMIALMILYSIVILTLNRVMKSVPGNLKREVISVNCQFFVFLVAYFTRVALFIIFQLFDAFSDNSITLIYLASILIMQILPTTVMLFLHYRAFNPRTLKEISNSFDQEENANRNMIYAS